MRPLTNRQRLYSSRLALRVLIGVVLLLSIVFAEFTNRLWERLQYNRSVNRALVASAEYLDLIPRVASITSIRSEYLSVVSLNNIKRRLDSLSDRWRDGDVDLITLEHAEIIHQKIDIIESDLLSKNDLFSRRARIEASAKRVQLETFFDFKMFDLVERALAANHILTSGEIRREATRLLRNTNSPTWEHLMFGDTGVLSITEGIMINQESLNRGARELSQSLEAMAASLQESLVRPPDRLISTPLTWLSVGISLCCFLLWRYIARLESNHGEQSRYEQRLDSLSELSGGVAHDIGNMISVVTGSLEILREQTKGKSKPLDRAMYAAEKSIHMIERLMIFSRQKRLKPEVFSVNEVLSELYEVVTLTCGEEINVRLRLPTNEILLEVDPSQFESCIVNLCLNAKHAMPSGGCLIMSVAQDKTGMVKISVSDTGCGIPRKVLSRVVEPFYSYSISGKPGGQGLGLSMVYGFVKHSGGDLKIDSEINMGTTVEMVFRAV